MSIMRCDSCGRAVDTDLEEMEYVLNDSFRETEVICQACAAQEALMKEVETALFMEDLKAGK